MPNLVVVVVTKLQDCHDIIRVWEEIGVTGATILDSVGMRHMKERQAHKDDLPLMPSLRALIEQEEINHRTIFSVVPDDFDLDTLIEKTEAIVGNFDGSQTGILFVMPVTRVHGLIERKR